MAAADSTFPFPHPELTPILGKPTGLTVTKLLTEVYANAMAVPSTSGGGNHGHLGSIIAPAAYITISAQPEPFEIPSHPGTQEPPPAGATAIQITNANRIYDTALRTYDTHHRLQQIIKSQIIQAVDHTYLAILEDALVGFANKKPQHLLDHLKIEYGTLNSQDLEDNRTTLSEPWNPDNPFEDLWTKIQKVRQIAMTNQVPITEAATIPLVLKSLERAGVYAHAILEWHTMPAANRTWLIFQDHFTRHEKARLLGLKTSQQAGFHGANAATTPPPAPTNAPNPPPGSQHVLYCWTHGITKPTSGHTSATCNNKADDHKDDATALNRQGGSISANCFFGTTNRQRGRPQR